MKTKNLASILSIACSAVVIAANQEAPSAKQLAAFPKNIARQHYATNLFLYDATAQRFVATEAAAAWLDDDVTTGWPALAGKQHYLLQLTEPQMITNFSLSTKASAGSITIYAGQQAAAPGDKTWQAVAKDVTLDSINQKRIGSALNVEAKYLLIETNITNPAPIYSLYVYGTKSASTEAIVHRAQAVDVRNTIGEFVNNQTAFSVSGLYANGRVTFANTQGGNTAWQRAIDDNAESFLSIAPSTTESGMIVKFDSVQPVSRLALLADQNARGKADIFLLAQAPAVGQAVSLEGLTPSVTLTFDGTSARSSADFAETNATAMVLRWRPESGEAALNVRELNVFSDLSLTDYEVSGAPAAIAQGSEDEKIVMAKNGEGKDGKEAIGEGKDVKAPIGEGKDVKEPIGEGPEPVASGPGFKPGSLGFPPRTPNNPVSP